MSKFPFSAVDAALGYFYQVRVALLWALRRLKATPDFAVSLETLDDVVFETKGGDPQDLLQTKHHRSREASLTNASADLWKTLRVWFEGHASGLIPPGTSLYLLTTATAPAGSAAARLRSHDRDPDVALDALLSTAQSSTDAANARAYSAFLDTPAVNRRAILDAVIIIDAAPLVTDLDRELRAEILWAAPRKDHDAFLERLEGWWLHRVLKQLGLPGEDYRILAAEVEAEMGDLREQFKQDSLPIDPDLITFALDEATEEAHANSVFVRQLELIQAGKRRIAAAVRDYYRAFEQRSRWLRNELLLVGELEKYERRLAEEWELVFEAMRDDVGPDGAEEAKLASARQVLAWAERALIPIRPRVTEPFVTRGSYHMLADEIRVGWHPDFRDRLASVLRATGESGASHDH